VFRVKTIFATALSATSAAGTPFANVAIKSVDVQSLTAVSEDLKIAFAVKSVLSGKLVPAKVITLFDKEADVTFGEDVMRAPNLQAEAFVFEQTLAVVPIISLCSFVAATSPATVKQVNLPYEMTLTELHVSLD